MTTEQADVFKALVGKTIVKVEVAGVNVWVLHFTDGTKKEILADYSGDLPYLYLNDIEWSPDFVHCSLHKGCLLEDGHKAKCSYL